MVLALVPVVWGANAQPSSFIPIDGNIRQAGGTFDWGNSGTAFSTCANGGVNAVGSNGLFNCGKANGTGTPIPPTSTLTPAQQAANGITSQTFVADPIFNSTVKDTGLTCVTSPFAASTGGDPTTFTSGADKNDNPLNGFTYGGGSLQPKDDIGNVYALAHRYTDGGGTTHNEVFFGGERTVNNGASHFDFEFLQQGVKLNPTPGSDPCAGTFLGHRAEGDLLMAVDFSNGGTLGGKTIYKWECTGSYTGTGGPAQNPAIGTVCDPASGNSAQYVQFPAAQQALVNLVVNGNATPIPCGGWVCRDEQQTNPQLVSTNEFMEGGFDLGDFGFAGGCLNTFLPHTRSSPDINSTLSDFVGPIRFNTCNVVTTDQSSATNSNFTNLAASPPAPTVPLGSWLRDTAVASGFNGQAGSVSFSLLGPLASFPADNNSCPTTPVAFGPNTKTAPANTISPASYTSDSVQATAAGKYLWVANYSSPGITSAEAASDCTTEEVTVTPASPTLSTTAGNPAGGIGVGQTVSISDTGSLSGFFGLQSGDTMTFTLKGPNSCSTTALGPFSDPVNTTTGQATTGPQSFTPHATGDYYWTATFSGDANNNPVSTAVGCGDPLELVRVGAQTPPVTTQASPQAATVGVPLTVGDSVRVTGNDGVTPTGTVTFTLVKSDCTTVVLGPSAVQPLSGVAGSSPAAASASYSTSWTPPATGDYYWIASYSGDGNYNPNTSACPDPLELVHVNAATPPVSTQASPQTGTVGIQLTVGDSATVTGNDGVVPTGTVTFTLVRSDCSAIVLGPSAAQPLSAIAGSTPSAASASFSTPWTPPATGDYYWIASYSGDANYNPDVSACPDPLELVHIGPQTPPVTTQATPQSATVGIALTVGDAATVTGNDGVVPTGTVTFTLVRSDCTTLVLGPSAPRPLSAIAGSNPSAASASLSTPWTPPATGDYYWIASYSGDANYNPSTSACPDPLELVHVSGATPPVTTQASPQSGTVGLQLTIGDTATVTGNDGVVPTGTVTFTLVRSDCSTAVLGPSAPQPLSAIAGSNPSAASASFSTLWTPPATGDYYWIASYSGDSNYTPNVSTCPDPLELVHVNSATPPVTTQANPQSGTVGVQLTVGDTATVTGNDGVVPTGTVTFTLVRSDCSTAVLGPSAPQSLNPIAGSNPSAASAIYSTPWTPPATGDYYWIASYSGDANYNPSTSACPDPLELVHVNPQSPPVTTQANPQSATVGRNLTVGDSATVTGNDGVVPTGTVTFTLVTSDCSTVALGPSAPQPLSAIAGSNPSAASASFSTSWIPPATGDYYWIASYSGDADYNPGTSACPDPLELVHVNPFTPPVTTQANPQSGTVGLQLTAGDSATVTGNDGVMPTGTVTFTLVRSDCSTVALGPSTPQPLNPIAGSSPSAATASFSTPWTPPATGDYYWIASYSGDGNYNASTSACPDPLELVHVNPATPPVTTQANPQSGTVGLQLTAGDSATVTGNDGVVPTGTVTFTLVRSDCSTVALGPSAPRPLSAVAGSNPSAATASFSTPWTPPATGDYYWVASYSGDGNYNPSTSACPDPLELLHINPQTPPVTTQASPQSGTVGIATTVGDSATVTGNDGVAPTGTVIFTLVKANCTTVVLGPSAPQPLSGIAGSAPSAASASFSTSFTPTATGDYYWIASYSGDGNYNASTSACPDPLELLHINPQTPPVTTQASPQSATVGISLSVADSATVTGNDGVTPTGTVTFTLVRADCTTVALGPSAPQPLSAVAGSNPSAATAGFSTSFTPTATGDYYWIASYSGDGNYNAATSACPDPLELLHVNPASPPVTTQANPQAANVGSPTTVGDTATVTGNGTVTPTGTVTFTLVASNCTTVVLGPSAPQPLGAISGSSPAAARATFSTTWTPANVGDYYWIASYSGDANYNPSTSACPDSHELVHVTGINAQITPTQTTCQQFSSGTAATLGQIQYSTKGKTISQVNPGVFFYWVKVTTGAGNQSVAITQTIVSNNQSRFFTVASGSSVYTATCSALASDTITQSGGTTTVSWNAGTTGGTFFIGIKYSTGGVVGETTPNPSTVRYVFATTGVGGSTQEIDLVKK